MTPSANPFTADWSQLGAAVAAVGSLGVAAFGIVESVGKAFAFTVALGRDKRLFHWGLPYVGLGVVMRMSRPLEPALRCAYGDGWAGIIAQQYRSNRSDGSAPDTIRQGVRLGLPFLAVPVAETLIARVWSMDPARALDLAVALQASTSSTPAGGAASAGPTSPGAVDPVQALAGRFATALDARITAAFQLADERYETVAKTWAGVAAIALALVFNWGLAGHGACAAAITTGCGAWNGVYSWPLAIGIGLVAVPLAPVAKDLSTSLQNALTAFKSISGKPS
ncbi:MAG TPA: hypothetical protein VFC47_12460 [Caulobacteraceae bacterium]|nr:hypothetical protein [Caulobacteraceae bacterium]